MTLKTNEVHQKLYSTSTYFHFMPPNWVYYVWLESPGVGGGNTEREVWCKLKRVRPPLGLKLAKGRLPSSVSLTPDTARMGDLRARIVVLGTFFADLRPYMREILLFSDRRNNRFDAVLEIRSHQVFSSPKILIILITFELMDPNFFSPTHSRFFFSHRKEITLSRVSSSTLRTKLQYSHRDLSLLATLVFFALDRERVN